MGRKGGASLEESFQRAAQALDTGNFAKALRLCKKIIVSMPNQPVVLELAAMAAYHSGNPGLAAEYIVRAVKIDPGNASLRTNLGVILQAANRFEEAEEAYRSVLVSSPDDFITLNNLGVVLLALERADEAIGVCRKAIEINPNFAGAHNCLGNALEDAGRLEDAVEAYQRALELDPSDLDVGNNLGGIIRMMGEFEKALEIFQKILEQAPENVLAHNNIGKTLMEQGKWKEAEGAFRKALEIDPGNSAAYTHIGNLFKKMGDLEAAEKSCRRALKLDPASAAAFYELPSLKSFSDDDPDLRSMETAYSGKPKTKQEKVFLGFSLAKAYEDSGAYGRAFEHLEEANRTVRSSMDYDVASDEGLAGRIVKAFKGPFPERKQDSSGGCTAIFVLGMPRSGTTLVEQILASHSDVNAGGELEYMGRLVENLKSGKGGAGDYPEIVLHMDADGLDGMGRDYLDCLRHLASGHSFVIDKMPLNFLLIGLIHLALPNSRIVHCRRDPVDTCFSCYKHFFLGQYSFAYDLAELGRYYRNVYAQLMNHWHKVLPGRILDVRYEDMVDDQERETRRLLEHCGLPWEDSCLDFHKIKRVVKTSSAAQVRRSIYKNAIHRWKNYKDRLGPLLDALGPLINSGES
jgi:tetratricopeptide (TPR) repeat protein